MRTNKAKKLKHHEFSLQIFMMHIPSAQFFMSVKVHRDPHKKFVMCQVWFSTDRAIDIFVRLNGHLVCLNGKQRSTV